MHASNVLFLFAAAGAASASIIAERVPFDALNARSTQQGWSLSASSAPAGTTSCGNGYYCPSSLTCNPAANDEVPACCTSGDCRGAVEGSPACADSTWSLWKGLNGNGFCCIVGQVGIYDYHNSVAGSCVASASAGATTAVLMSTGSGAGATSMASASTSMASAATTTSASSATAASTAASSGATASTSASTSASASASASTSASGSSTASSSAANASSTVKTNGAEKVAAAGFSVVAMGLAAVLAL